MTAGLPSYCAGSFAWGQSPGKFWVTGMTITGNVVTLSVRQYEGNVPAVGNLITVQGTTVGGAAPNVTRVAITAQTIVASSGVGSITYPATAANIAQTNDGGQATIDVAEVAENCGVQKLQQFVLDPVGGYGLTWAYTCPTNPATLSIQLEAAINDNDAEYAIVGTASTAVAGATTIGTVPELCRFVRLNETINTGGGTIIAKILQSTTK